MSQSTAESDLAETRPEENGPEQPESPARSPWYLQWAIVLGAVALVLAPAIWGTYPSEIARWHDAAAREKYLSGDLAGALADLDTALTWNNTSAGRYQRRAEYRREAEDYAGSLEDLNAALKLSPSDLQLLLERATTFQHLGRHKDAIADYKAIERQVAESGGEPLDRLNVMNGVAYARGVGNRELKEGLAGAEAVVKLLGGDAYILEQVGYLHVSRKDWQRAEARLREAEEILKVELATQKAKFEQTTDPEARRRIREQAEPEETRLASVQFQLAQAYRQLHRTSDAEEHEKLYRQWSKSEKILRKKLPHIKTSWNLAIAFAGCIDTRGYLHYRVGNLAAARHDLELAFELVELEYKRPSERFKSDRVTITDMREYERLLAQRRKNVAVILYHRGLVYKKLGLEELAAKDLHRVQDDFGFTPDDHLF